MFLNVHKIFKINDPIHNFIIFPEFMRKIVDTKAMQRLNRVRQLSGANHVFPGANHTRFEHSIGVAYLSQSIIKNLIQNNQGDLDNDDLNDCIVGALCHDIGHGPFSHNFETVLLNYYQKNHEDYTKWIVADSEFGDVLEDQGFDKNYIAKMATGLHIAEGNPKGSILTQIITSSVNADSMDYLLRDNYHCGTPGRVIDVNRLILSMEIMDEGMLGVDISSLLALEGYLLARISSFRTIYFHKTLSCSANHSFPPQWICLQKILFLIFKPQKIT